MNKTLELKKLIKGAGSAFNGWHIGVHLSTGAVYDSGTCLSLHALLTGADRWARRRGA